MARKPDNVGDTTPETVVKETRKETQKPAEAETAYTAAEFAQNAARLFGTRATADIVTAAFRVDGKETATLSEAKKMVEQFMNKEVR